MVQWFLENDEAGQKRTEPYDSNMLTPENGVDVAVRFMQWVAENFPGHTWRKKAKQLVCSSMLS